MAYSINQMAMITGLTTRTLRTHLKNGLLKGEKADGNWRFSDQDIDEYLSEPSVRQTISARQNAVIYDFLSDPFKRGNRICTIMDFPVPMEEALEIARFFGEEICREGHDIEFRFINEKNCARFILAGAEDAVAGLVRAYYAR